MIFWTLYILSAIIFAFEIFKCNNYEVGPNISILNIISFTIVFVPIINMLAAATIVFEFFEKQDWFSLGEWLTKPRFCIKENDITS